MSAARVSISTMDIYIIKSCYNYKITTAKSQKEGHYDSSKDKRVKQNPYP